MKYKLSWLIIFSGIATNGYSQAANTSLQSFIAGLDSLRIQLENTSYGSGPNEG